MGSARFEEAMRQACKDSSTGADDFSVPLLLTALPSCENGGVQGDDVLIALPSASSGRTNVCVHWQPLHDCRDGCLENDAKLKGYLPRILPLRSWVPWVCLVSKKA